MNEQYSEENKKKGNGLLVTVIILLVVLIGAVGILIYQNFQDDNTKPNDTDKDIVEKDEDKDKEKDKIRELTKSEIDVLEKQIQVYNERLSSYYPLVSLNNISNQELLNFASVQIRIENDWTFTDFTTNQVNAVISKYFGENVNLIHEDILCSSDNESIYTYDKAESTYKHNSNHPGHGGGGTSYNEVYYFKGNIKNETEITFQAKVLYGDYCGDLCGPNQAYYTSYEDSFNQTNPILKNADNGGEELVITDSDYKRIENKIPVTTYTFTKDSNGNYGLKSVTVQ